MGRRPDPRVREAILQEAEHLIHLKGYHSTSMEDIARSCGMTKANLFHHYGSKEDLALAVLDWKMDDDTKRKVEPACCSEDPAAAIDRLFSAAASFYAGNGCKAGCFVGNIALEMADSNEAFRLRASRFFEAWASRLAACLRKAQKSGALDSDLEPVCVSEAVVALYEGAVMLARTRRDPTVFKRVGKVARSLVETRKVRDRR